MSDYEITSEAKFCLHDKKSGVSCEIGYAGSDTWIPISTCFCAEGDFHDDLDGFPNRRDAVHQA